MPGERGWKQVALLSIVSGLWFAMYFVLRDNLYRILPMSFVRLLTEQSYMALVQSLTTAFGLTLAFLGLSTAKADLDLRAPSGRALFLVLLVAPAVYVAYSYFAITIARPTLLEELRRGGRALAQSGTGDFGKSIQQASAGMLIFAYVVIAPAAEELMFRGAAWSFVQALLAWIVPAPKTDDAPPSSSADPELALAGVVEDAAVVRAAQAVGGWLRDGGVATLLVTALFGAMHADGSGGLGIVRVASATCIGLACGCARQATGSVLGAIVLHTAINLLSLATTRHWVVGQTLGVHHGVPIFTSALAVPLLIAAVVAAVVTRKRA